MAKHAKRTREKARELYLTGEVSNLAEIARRVGVKPHTVGGWKRDEDWDALRLKIERRAAEQMVERVATERVNLNAQHFKLWGVVLSKLVGTLQTQGLNDDGIKALDKVAGILDRAQKGQRLARGLSLDGATEEQIRAESEATHRSLVDLFMDVVKTEITDEPTRDRIARALLEAVPATEEAHAD